MSFNLPLQDGSFATYNQLLETNYDEFVTLVNGQSIYITHEVTQEYPTEVGYYLVKSGHWEFKYRIRWFNGKYFSIFITQLDYERSECNWVSEVEMDEGLGYLGWVCRLYTSDQVVQNYLDMVNEAMKDCPKCIIPEVEKPQVVDATPELFLDRNLVIPDEAKPRFIKFWKWFTG